jgi:hypothetical protein
MLGVAWIVALLANALLVAWWSKQILESTEGTQRILGLAAVIALSIVSILFCRLGLELNAMVLALLDDRDQGDDED